MHAVWADMSWLKSDISKRLLSGVKAGGFDSTIWDPMCPADETQHGSNGHHS